MRRSNPQEVTNDVYHYWQPYERSPPRFESRREKAYMAIKVNNWKSYNDVPLQAGEVLVPQLVSKEYAAGLGANMANLRTWEKSGISYLVMFIPVPKDQEKQAWSIFNAEVNELLDEKLGPNRFSRCMVPQPDGSKKPCPKKKGNNHESCANCPFRNIYEKEDRATVSLNELAEMNYAAGAESHIDDDYKVEMLLEDLINKLEQKNPKLARIVNLSFIGYDKDEIFEDTGVKKSQGYDLWNEAERLAKEFLYN